MNQPFKPDILQPILAAIGVGISDLKRNPAAVIAAAREQQVAILNRNKPVAYLISPEAWEYLCAMHEDLLDTKLVRERLEKPDDLVEVSIDDL